MPKPPTKYNKNGEAITPFRTSKETTKPLRDMWLKRVIWVPPLTDDQIGFDEEDG